MGRTNKITGQTLDRQIGCKSDSQVVVDDAANNRMWANTIAQVSFSATVSSYAFEIKTDLLLVAFNQFGELIDDQIVLLSTFLAISRQRKGKK